MMAIKPLDTQQLKGELLFDEPMSKHTSWRVGGPADCYFKPQSVSDLQCFLKQLDRDQAITFVGLGSNLLVRDGGIRGAVIAPLTGLNEIKENDGLVYAQAGVSCAKFARYCQKNHWLGLDFLAGIPGTIGGAAAMNAGAFGSEVWEFIDSIEVINRNGQLRQINKKELIIQYREVNLAAGDWIVGVSFQLNREVDKQSQRADIKVLLDKRNQSQPIGLASCGSVFRNPDNDFAARLIEEAGLKGHCIGDACVSQKHANFIINNGQCSAQDLEDLIALVKNTVAQKFAVDLILEAHVVGEYQ